MSPTAIATETFSPESIRIRPQDLPLPFATASARNPAQGIPVPDNARLKVPKGFVVTVYAEGLNGPRWLATTPDGKVLVTETPDNAIRLLEDRDRDGAIDASQRFAGPDNGLDRPFGMAFAGNSFYVGNQGDVRQFDYAFGQTELVGTGDKLVDLPAGGHWTRNVVASPSGDSLYISVGSRSNASEEPFPRASVFTLDLNGGDREPLATELRNPVGFDFHPVTGKPYTVVNERDGLGDDLVPDFLTGLERGDFLGWPYTYITPDRLDPRQLNGNGESTNPDLASQTQTPDVLFQAHTAPIGMQFYDSYTFPDRYRNGAFVASRGSWNRSTPTGYELLFVPFGREGQALGSYEPFVTGFLTLGSEPTTWARPTGLMVHPDGSVLFTDETHNRIYRVQYDTSRRYRDNPLGDGSRPAQFGTIAGDRLQADRSWRGTYGGLGNDRVDGDDTGNLILGNLGDDRLLGNRGNDTLIGGDGSFKEIGGAGDRDSLDGGAGNDGLYGSEGWDLLAGGSGDDSLYGGKDTDTLNGDAGDDWLDGSWGSDVLSGGAGNDAFVLRANLGTDRGP